MGDTSLFIFHVSDGLTNYWHSGGDALVIAHSEDEARTMIPDTESIDRDDPQEIELVGTLALVGDFASPDLIRVSPDAGCC